MRSWLKEKREEKSFTHEDVAAKAGISRSYYTLIESGSKTPSVDVAKAIAKVLEFPWIVFFEEESSRKERLTVSNAETA